MRMVCVAAIGFLALLPAPARAESPLDALANIWRAVWSVAPRIENSSQAEAAAGIRQALAIAVRDTRARIARAGGLAEDPRLRIPLPGRLGEAQAALGPLGKAGALDTLDLSVNRAADAVLPDLFAALLRATHSLPITDGLAVARSGDTAATLYLKQETEKALAEALKPELEARLQSEGAFEVLVPAAALAGAGPRESQLRDDLIAYALQATIDSAFRGVADAESELRRDRARHTTPELQAAFGRPNDR